MNTLHDFSGFFQHFRHLAQRRRSAPSLVLGKALGIPWSPIRWVPPPFLVKPVLHNYHWLRTSSSPEGGVRVIDWTEAAMQVNWTKSFCGWKSKFSFVPSLLHRIPEYPWKVKCCCSLSVNSLVKPHCMGYHALTNLRLAHTYKLMSPQSWFSCYALHHS